MSASGEVKCIPMIGAMTFYSDCDTCSYPESEILASIEAAIDGGKFIDTDLIQQVNFVGTGDVLITASEAKNSGFKGMSLGLGMGILAVASLFVYVRKARKKTYFESLEEQGESNDAVSIESKGPFSPENYSFGDVLTILEDDEGVNVTL